MSLLDRLRRPDEPVFHKYCPAQGDHVWGIQCLFTEKLAQFVGFWKAPVDSRGNLFVIVAVRYKHSQHIVLASVDYLNPPGYKRHDYFYVEPTRPIRNLRRIIEMAADVYVSGRREGASNICKEAKKVTDEALAKLSICW